MSALALNSTLLLSPFVAYFFSDRSRVHTRTPLFLRCCLTLLTAKNLSTQSAGLAYHHVRWKRRVAWWLNGRALDLRSGVQLSVGTRSRNDVGKLFTPLCIDADSLRYYAASLK